VSTAAPPPISPDALAYEFVGALRRLWWIPLILGIIWIAFALVVLRFDTRSVNAVASWWGSSSSSQVSKNS